MKKFFVSLALCISLAMCSAVNVMAEAIPSVIEQNIAKLESISDYGAEFVVDYVSESWDYNTVENILVQIQTISDEVCYGCSNDYEKINAIHSYVSSNIAYDHDAKHNAVTFDVISLENVLEKKRTTCAGFSNLFSSMCNAQGIYCVNIRGSALSAEDGIYADNLDDENTVMNHEWNAVYYEDEQRWIYIDCTWDSPNTFKNGEFYYGNGAQMDYFDISVENISKNHKATLVDHREFFNALTVLEKPETTVTEQISEPVSEEITVENNDVIEYQEEIQIVEEPVIIETTLIQNEITETSESTTETSVQQTTYESTSQTTVEQTTSESITTVQLMTEISEFETEISVTELSESNTEESLSQKTDIENSEKKSKIDFKPIIFIICSVIILITAFIGIKKKF